MLSSLIDTTEKRNELQGPYPRLHRPRKQEYPGSKSIKKAMSGNCLL